MLSLAIAPHEAPPATLNLYSVRPAGFDVTSQAIGAAVALQAAVAMHCVGTIVDLERAVQTRDVIGQAKGILVKRFGLDGRRAFAQLVRTSQETNTKLADVAHRLVADADPPTMDGTS